MTGSELSVSLGICHPLEGLEVGRLTELIVPCSIAVVHHHPRLSIEALAHANTLNSLLAYLYMTVNLRPLRAVRLARLGCELLCRCLKDTAVSLALIEEVIELVGIVIHYVAVDSSRTAIEHIYRLTLKVGEILVHV